MRCISYKDKNVRKSSFKSSTSLLFYRSTELGKMVDTIIIFITMQTISTVANYFLAVLN